MMLLFAIFMVQKCCKTIPMQIDYIRKKKNAI
jgi:hypothetical protein